MAHFAVFWPILTLLRLIYDKKLIFGLDIFGYK